MTAKRRPSAWLRRLLAVALCWGSVSAASSAHEPGVTRVDLEVAADGQVVAVVPADPVVLWRDRILTSGRVPPGNVDFAQIDAEAPALARHLAQRVHLSADDTPVRLSLVSHEWTVDRPEAPATSRRLVVRLQGRLPSAAARLSWTHGLATSDYPISLRQEGRASPRVVWVAGNRASEVLSLAPAGTLATVGQYTWLGIVHIVPRGLDHILFVLGLFLLARAWRPLLLQVSAFTLAHTAALGASVIGVVHAPAAIVEPLIAASIAWVAIENVWRPSMSRARLVVVFVFGLLHGAGFAGVLGELGLPAGARLLALVSFNVGVEVGQLLVIAGAFALTSLMRHDAVTYRRVVVVPASLVIAVVGAYWTITRLVGA